MEPTFRLFVSDDDRTYREVGHGYATWEDVQQVCTREPARFLKVAKNPAAIERDTAEALKQLRG